MASQSCLSQETTNGKKNTKEVGCRNYDKDQQHRGHCQDDEGSKFLHMLTWLIVLLGMAALPDELEEAFPDSKPAGS